MEFRLFSVQFMRHVMSVAFMIDANILEPLYKGHHDGGKRWPVMRGKMNMICIEWCMEMDRISQI